MVDNPITEGQRIAVLNDRLRTRIGCLDGLAHWKAQVWMTASIASLPPALQLAIQERVRTYDDFSEDNDPYGEHDFGAFDMPTVGKIFWKIDYYAPDMRWGSEDPADPKKTVRVLTIMLASEY